MTEAEMIEEYNELDDKCGDLQDRIDDLNSDLETVCGEMGEVEEEWLKTHKCACGLIGLENSCSHDKN